MQNTHLEIDFSVVNFEVLFLHKFKLYWPKTIKNAFFFHIRKLGTRTGACGTSYTISVFSSWTGNTREQC